MTAAALQASDDQVVCFGVACPHHGRCELYIAVDHATTERRIGTCEQAGKFPRFKWHASMFVIHLSLPTNS